MFDRDVKHIQEELSYEHEKAAHWTWVGDNVSLSYSFPHEFQRIVMQFHVGNQGQGNKHDAELWLHHILCK